MRRKPVIRYHTRRIKIYNFAEVNFSCLAGIFFFLPYKVENLQLILRRKKKI
jgi:hypothetical protein